MMETVLVILGLVLLSGTVQCLKIEGVLSLTLPPSVSVYLSLSFALSLSLPLQERCALMISNDYI